jgi:anionic cell wall polymer biosynthesis LytR-Cps2A-Psr (LCP) family protein
MYKKVLIVAGLIGVFLVGLFGSYFTLTYVQSKKPLSIKKAKSVDLSGTPIPAKNDDGSYNIVLLGTGGTGHSGGGLTDSIIIIHGNPQTKKAALITIPRDLWVTGNYKINATAVNVGVENLEGVLQNITGLKIDSYISVNFGNFIKLIDELGGVDVVVPRSFSDDFYPIRGEENNTCGKTESEVNSLKSKYSGFDLEKQFPCRYEQIHYDQGSATINGENALKFVRSRHGDSDFGRSLRQIAVIIGIKNKLISLELLNKLEDTYSTFWELVTTDLNFQTIRNLTELFVNPESYEIKQLQLTTDNVLNSSTSANGQFILVPKAGMFEYSGIKEYISQNL